MPAVEIALLVLGEGIGGQRDDRRAAGPRLALGIELLDGAGGFEAVELRHEDVHQHEVECRAPRRASRA